MPTPDAPHDDAPDAGDDWAEAPDRWAEADQAYQDKWSDEADETDAGAPPPGYVPAVATPKAVHDAYGDGMRAAGPYLGLGVQIAASMALFCGLGYAVDEWLGSRPWGILVGAMLGMAGIVVLLVRLARESDQKGRRAP